MKQIIFKHLLVLCFLPAMMNILSAQTANGLINLHINCNGCDMNFLRQEITYLNHVRDLGLADVQAFIRPIQSGNGARLFELKFTGMNEFDGLDQSLIYETNPIQTNDEVRRGLLKRIEAGLLPYLLKTSIEEDVTISITPKEINTQDTEVQEEDPWKYWIFEVWGSADIDTESQRNSIDLEFGADANRITEEWKIQLTAEINNTSQKFESDEESFSSIRNRHFAQAYIVNSLGKYWSAGVFARVQHNTFRNLDFSYEIAPALEYSLFPYEEAIRREITFVYRIRHIHNEYIEQTIFGETSENLFRQSLAIRSRFRQPWGDLFASLEGSNFLHDFSKNRLQFNSWMNIRLFQGFSLRVSSRMELIRDLINLPAGEQSLEDILLRQRQISTDFTLSFGVGISYTFGSAFNSVVNPRL